MNSEELINCKECFKVLSKSNIDLIIKYFNNSNIKQKKIMAKQKKNNIFKNSKFRLDKNKIKNKIILILNKVSENNLDNLLIEFICNITIENEEDYYILQKEIYLKLLKDIKFVNNILNFVSVIFKIIYYKKQLLPNYFYYLIETKLQYDYNNIELDDEDLFLSELSSESDREAHLKLIYNLNKKNYFKIDIIKIINELLLCQDKKIPDIYYWYKLNDNNIIDSEKILVKNKINNLSLNNRDKILLESLINNLVENNTIILDSSVEETNITDSDSFLVEIQNIIEEYIYLKDNEEIIEFLKSNCSDFDKKNSFCMYLIQNFFVNTEINWINLFNLLINKKYIYKSNLSKGLLLYSKKINQNKKVRMKELLIFLKQKNITKNIEFIFKKNNIKINY